MIRNLTKENFFDEVYDAYPDAVDHFWKWFAEYKTEIGWDQLFGNHTLLVGHTNFSDIPFEMQNGIIARFELELFNNKQGKGKEEYVAVTEHYRSQIVKLFADLQKQIERLKKVQGK